MSYDGLSIEARTCKTTVSWAGQSDSDALISIEHPQWNQLIKTRVF